MNINIKLKKMWRLRHITTEGNKKICYLDIDGILNDYPQSWLDYIGLEAGVKFDSVSEAKAGLCYRDYMALKNGYRCSDFKYNLKIKKDAKALLDFLCDKGYSVVLVTTRPSRYPQLVARTLKWLLQNGLSFDDVVFCRNKNKMDLLEFYPDFVFGVEDDEKTVLAMRHLGFKMFLVKNNGFNRFKDVMGFVNNAEDKNENVYCK